MGCCSSVERDCKRTALRATPFFFHLDEQELNHFALFFVLQRFRQGDLLCRQREVETCFYVVVEGYVETYVEHDGRVTIVSEKHEGDFFGEATLFDATAARTSFVKAADLDNVMLVMEKSAFLSYLNHSQTPPGMRARLHTVTGQHIRGILKNLDFLQHLSSSQAQLLADLFRYVTYEAQEVVFEEGELGSCFYIIAQGSCSLSVTISEGVNIPLTERLRSGDYFGEIALMISTPRSASITAAERSLLLRLDVKDLEQFMQVAHLSSFLLFLLSLNPSPLL
jgi:CRP-like cAMP-binding protein